MNQPKIRSPNYHNNKKQHNKSSKDIEDNRQSNDTKNTKNEATGYQQTSDITYDIFHVIAWSGQTIHLF
jgi:hypothetical protein